MTAISTFPSIDPLAVMIIFVVLPPIIIIVTIKQIWHKYHWRGGLMKKTVSNLGIVLNHHAPLVTIVNGFLGILLFLNQGAYFLNNFSPSSDIKYYIRVNRPEFINFNLIFNARALNSIAAIRLAIKQQTRRLSELEDLDVSGEYAPAPVMSEQQWIEAANYEQSQHRHSDYQQGDYQQDHGRRLATTEALSKPTDILNLIYHRSDWGDLISSDQLTDICLTERNILAHVDCIETTYDYTFRSFIEDHFNTSSCEFKKSYEEARGQVGQFVNQRYFQDRTMYSSIRSPILISYMRSGTCGELYSTDEFAALINAQAVGDTLVVPASFKFLGDELRAATEDLKDVMIYSTLFAFLFLIFSVRGVVTAIATLFCILLSMVNAGALMNRFGFGGFSAYNVASLLVLLSVGAGFVHLYGAAWRRIVKRGKNASAQCLMEIFGTVGQGNLLTFLACCLAFFALGTAPIIFMSQLGTFVGMSMFMFFISFHYIIIPLWVWTSWYTIPSRYHHQMRIYRQTYLPLYMQSKHDREHMHHHHHHDNTEGGTDRHRLSRLINSHNAGAGDHHEEEENEDGYRHSDSDSDSESTVSVQEVVAIAPDQVRFAADGEGHHDAVEAVEATLAEDDEGLTYDDQDAEGNVEGGARARRKKKRTEQAGEGAAPIAGDGTTPAQITETATEDGDSWALSLSCIGATICSGKRPVKMVGFFMVLLTVFLILLSAILSQQKMETNFAYAQLVNKPSNLATVIKIMQLYRGDVFYAVDDDNSATIEIPFTGSRAPTVVPTARPTVANNPTAVPTARPTVSSKPTTQPTLVPTSAPTTAPTANNGEPDYVYTDFRITGCWGLSDKRLHYDSGIDPHFGYYSFKNYMEKGDQGIVGDFVATCDYVDSHRDYLNVHPDWNRTTDCIANQYFDVYNSSYFDVYNTTKRSVATTLFAWGTTYDNAPTMVGLYSNESKKDTIPVWVCANFTGRTDLRTFHDDMPFGTEMRQRWEDVFYKHGSKYARQNGISTVVGSTEFTYPLLGLYVTSLVQYQAAVFIIGFPILFLIFTVFDFGLTLFGVLGLFTSYLLTIFIGLYQVSSLLDISDVVVLVLLLPLLVCFNIHLTTSYMSHRLIAQRKAHTHDASIQFLSPALVKTQQYMVKALTGPMILAVVAAIAFTWSEYPIMRRFGHYYMICAIVAYLFSVIVQPFLLAFSCKSNFCTFEFEEDEAEGPASPSPALPPPGPGDLEMVNRGANGAPQGQRQLRPMPSDMAMSNHNMSRHGSQFQMNSVYGNNTSQFMMDNDARSDVHEFPTAMAPARRRGSGAPSTATGSVASRSDLQSRASEADDYYDNDDSGYDPNTQYMAQGQARGVAYGNAYQENYPGDMPAPAYGYGDASQQQYDEYGRPVQVMQMPMQQVMMAPQQPQVIMMAPQPQVMLTSQPSMYVQSPPQQVYIQQQSPPQPQYVQGYRRMPTMQTMIPQPPPQQQQYYYPQQQQEYQAQGYEQGYEDDQTEQYTDQGDDDQSQYSSSVAGRQMYPPPRQPAQPQTASAAPSFYSNGRNAVAARQAMQQSMQNINAAGNNPPPVTGYRRDANPLMRPPVPPLPRHPPQSQQAQSAPNYNNNRAQYGAPQQQYPSPPGYGRPYPPQQQGQPYPRQPSPRDDYSL